MIDNGGPGAQVTAVHRQQPWGNGFEVLNAGRASPQLALMDCFAKQPKGGFTALGSSFVPAAVDKSALARSCQESHSHQRPLSQLLLQKECRT